MRCPKCGDSLPNNSKSCPGCGTYFSATTNQYKENKQNIVEEPKKVIKEIDKNIEFNCRSCNELLTVGTKTCSKCGNVISAAMMKNKKYYITVEFSTDYDLSDNLDDKIKSKIRIINKVAYVTCNRCGKQSPQSTQKCKWCGAEFFNVSSDTIMSISVASQTRSRPFSGFFGLFAFNAASSAIKAYDSVDTSATVMHYLLEISDKETWDYIEEQGIESILNIK